MYTPCLSTNHDKRLDRQLVHVIKGVDADVVALQEVHADHVRDQYAAHFQATHDMYAGQYVNVVGALSAQALYAALAWLCVAVLQRLVLALSVLTAGTLPDDLVPASMTVTGLGVVCYVAVWRMLHKTATINFLTGSCHGGLALAVRRSAFTIKARFTRSFSEQRGDILNFFRPRSFQCVVLEPVECAAEPAAVPRFATVLINLHMNLGEDDTRERQLDEACRFAEKQAEVLSLAGTSVSIIICGDTNALEDLPSMQNMRAQRGYTDAFLAAGTGKGHTWCSTNHLTRGFLLEPNGRLDYIFVKGDLHPSVSVTPPQQQLQQFDDAAESRVLLTPILSTVVLKEEGLSDHFGLLCTFEVHPALRTRTAAPLAHPHPPAPSAAREIIDPWVAAASTRSLEAEMSLSLFNMCDEQLPGELAALPRMHLTTRLVSSGSESLITPISSCSSFEVLGTPRGLSISRRLSLGSTASALTECSFEPVEDRSGGALSPVDDRLRVHDAYFEDDATSS